MNVVGVIAAGGASSRMGSDKATLELGGVSFVERIHSTLRAIVDEVVVGGPSGLLGAARRVADPEGAVAGPLAALAAAMVDTDPADAVVLVAVDQPLLRAATLVNLLDVFDGSGAVVPVADGRRQVTCAVYPAKWARETLAEATVNRGSLQSLLDRLPCLDVPEQEWRSWGEDGRSWFSVDTPELLARAVEWARSS